MRAEDVDTPALIVEMDALERNLRRMAGAAARAGARLRPHAKMHNCPALALRQIALGAVGVCCQKVSEAEAMVAGGVTDDLISNDIVGASKLARLAALARHARIGVCVYDAGNAGALSIAACTAGTSVDAYVEFYVGANRRGVEAVWPVSARGAMW